ncbi:MAG: hypothetical protein K0U64_02820 [Actinomycetia bacterium]|nr:hypothetical protein [Actinomycetes bacterium]
MITHVECPSCRWVGAIPVQSGRALCPDCEWFFHMPQSDVPQEKLDASWLATDDIRIVESAVL